MIRPPRSRAPSCSSSSRASCRAVRGGGSIQGRSSPRASPHSASCSTIGRGSHTSSSGGSKPGRRCSSPGDQSRRQRPGPNRPARPRRCSALARLAGRVTSRSRPVAGSKRLRRLRPASITSVTPAIVSELSAIEVASTTLPPAVGAGAIAWPWWARESWPCSGVQATCWPQAVASIARWASAISRWPGRNTSTVSAGPRSSSQWFSRARTTCCSSRSRSRGR